MAPTTIGAPLFTVRVRSATVGGVASLTQKRNVKAPARAADGLSKTTS